MIKHGNEKKKEKEKENRNYNTEKKNIENLNTLNISKTEEEYKDVNEEEEEEEEEREEEQEIFESDLGNKDHWDNAYSEEITQFENNRDEIGYVWCGKQIQNKTIQYINNNFLNKDIKIMDIGCGNGALLFELIKIGFSNLKGMDYSEKSIELACNIKKHKITQGEKLCENILFYKEDINNPTNNSDFFDVIHDKGTFDAFMLNKNNSFLNYANYLNMKMKDKSILIISSVNHLKEELLEYFININKHNLNDLNDLNNINNLKIDKIFSFSFELVEEIPHKLFNFGGNNGQSVTTLIFKINKQI
jgi:2-polyprenyl-3-methyl-5-hydroxy-6-metoxy-1,4-benzoquinol methylase